MDLHTTPHLVTFKIKNMGLNFFVRTKVTPTLKLEIIEEIMNENFERAKNLMPERIHIGKSSAGWRFGFNHNNWEYFEKTEDSFKDFLKNNLIEDEYGRSYTYEEFWEKVISKEKDKYTLKWNNEITATIEFGLIFSTSTNFC